MTEPTLQERIEDLRKALQRVVSLNCATSKEFRSLAIIDELWDDNQRMAAEIACGVKVNNEQQCEIGRAEESRQMLVEAVETLTGQLAEKRKGTEDE